MSENVVYLHPRPEPVAHYLRLGAFHRQVEKLLAAGRLPVERVVVEASAFTHQKDVVGQLVDAGRELMLDTNVAELSAVGRYSGAAKSAPWAQTEAPLQPEHFARGSSHDVIGKIARFAVEHGFHASEMLQRANERLAQLGPVLRDLDATVGDGPHARAPARRGNGAAGARAARR